MPHAPRSHIVSAFDPPHSAAEAPGSVHALCVSESISGPIRGGSTRIRGGGYLPGVRSSSTASAFTATATATATALPQPPPLPPQLPPPLSLPPPPPPPPRHRPRRGDNGAAVAALAAVAVATTTAPVPDADARQRSPVLRKWSHRTGGSRKGHRLGRRGI